MNLIAKFLNKVL